MTPPTIKALGIVQDGAPTRWRARGYVEGVGWLEAWGPSLIGAMAALQALAAQRVAQHEEDMPPVLDVLTIVFVAWVVGVVLSMWKN